MSRPSPEEIEAAYIHWRMLQFWSYVDQRGPDECWPWLGGRDTKGYGTFCLHSKKQKAHRLICKLKGRPIPDHLVGMHTCNHKWCVNPDHIEPGTDLENIRAAYRDGLVPKQTGPRPRCRGENAGRCKYPDAIVRSLRSRCANGETLKAVAREYGIPYRYASAIKNGRHRSEAA
jgi:hypothetical protein